MVVVAEENDDAPAALRSAITKARPKLPARAST